MTSGLQSDSLAVRLLYDTRYTPGLGLYKRRQSNHAFGSKPSNTLDIFIQHRGRNRNNPNTNLQIRYDKNVTNLTIFLELLSNNFLRSRLF